MSETSGNEVSAPRHTHRVYSLDLKQQNVLETLQPGSSVAAVARQHGINVDQNEIVTVSKIRLSIDLITTILIDKNTIKNQ
jgi:hypothetical protein